ncbi:hypothetical protein [Microvirga sp. BSC39]|uniref:hypothetical protein n=1 Tax=Microvirga sp. BSC39 TaxID=1549810 RepID=UPI0004E8A3CA|nr:hypothetical protein [Microvirga sp. BSC39]KFG66603.1 hypothetical protein JH26_27620 [Microvirga sp. BSC39]
MIIALLALALAMILGGLLAAFFGWDIVLVERGWTMVIAGSITAASGALLLGIAAAVSKLAKIEKRLSGLQAGSGINEFSPGHRVPGALAGAGLGSGLAAAEAAGAFEESATEDRNDESQPTLPLFEEQERREQDELQDKPQDNSTVAAAEWPEHRDAAPVIPFPPRTTPVVLPAEDEQDSELKVPDFLLADRQRNDEEGPLVAEPGLDVEVFEQGNEREPEARDRDRGDEPLEPVADVDSEVELQRDSEPAAAETDQEAFTEDEATSGEEGPATIIGTYNSGDNKYVMFSDGSIEAQTPSGTFRFQSLDELKEFIAAGGEGNSSASL